MDQPVTTDGASAPEALGQPESPLAAASLHKGPVNVNKEQVSNTSTTLTTETTTHHDYDDKVLESSDEQQIAESVELQDDYVDTSEQVVKSEDASGQSDDEEDEPVEDDNASLCQFTANCNTGSRDYRKVISHIFGRNKKCTTQIPDSCWIIYCRKHYQRTRYRTNKAQIKTYFNIQFDNLSRQLTRMERWGGVRSWTIALRKKERGMCRPLLVP